MAACGPSTSWSTRLADVVQQAADLRGIDVGAELGRHDRREVAGLDAVDEHVLAVARAVLEPAEQLDELGGEARGRRRRRPPARRPGGSRGRPRRCALLTTSSMRPGWMRPSAMSLVSARRATSRRTGSKPDSTTVSGVSSMIRSTPVACSRARMLRPSRPMIRPFISSLGRWTTVTVCSAVWSAATRCIAVTMTSRAFSWASSRARRSIARDSLTASCSASSRIASSSTPLASSADSPDTRSSATTCSWCSRVELLALVLEVALAVVDLAALLLEHVRALVELLVARQEAPLEVLELGPLRARLVLGLARQGAASRPWPRGSCPSAASAPRRRCARPCPVRTSWSGLTSMPRATNPTAMPTTRGDHGRDGDDRVPSSVPPIRRTDAAGGVGVSGSGYAAPAIRLGSGTGRR